MELIFTANIVLCSARIGWAGKRRKMGSALDQAHETIYQTCLKVPLVDAHAHNIVALDSSLPFLQCLSDERGHEALSGVPLSLAYQVYVSPHSKCYTNASLNMMRVGYAGKNLR